LLEESRVIAWNPTQDQMQSQMTQYFTTSECRWHFLLKAFGFSKEADKIKCGSCDNCLKR
jgi:ATP-dependent DNA helicase RecQ